MSTSFLQRKRKGDLLELAQQVHLPDADRMLKDDLVAALADHLDANETRYGKLAALTDYYNKRVSSPVKRERSSPAVEAEAPVTRRGRRSTLRGLERPVEVEPEITPERRVSVLKRTPRTATATATETISSVTRALPTRTPTTVTPRMPSSLARVAQLSAPAEINLPASPAQVADMTEQTIQTAREAASELWAKTRIMEGVAYLRENASSVMFIQLAILLLEAAGMQWKTLRTLCVYTNPSTSGLPVKEIHIPDMTYLLTEGFWAPATLWSLTNWALPLLFSYFINLTVSTNTRHKSSRRQYMVDPLTFNIARALLVYSAYSLPVADVALVGEPGINVGRTPGWGPFSDETITTVRGNVPGNYYGMQISSIIGALYSLYDAILKK